MEPDPLPWVILGIVLSLLVCANISEIVYAFVNRSEVRQRLEQGVQNAANVDRLLHDTTYLFLSLNIIKYTSILFIGAISTFLILKSMYQWQAAGIAVLGWLLLALLQPMWRAMALRRTTTLAFSLTPFVTSVLMLLRPLAVIIHQIHQWMGADFERSEDVPFSDEALRQLVNNTESKEELEDNEREMIVSILELNETSAREIMVPRIDMVTISIDTSLHDALDVIIDAGHSRIPVYEDNVDSVVGLLYAKDLLACFRDNQMQQPLKSLLRPPYFVPASKKVDAVFQEMQLQRVHMAMVVDEYGGTAGLVSIEDILEEIVGEIQDEYDVDEDAYVQSIGPDAYLLNSRLDVYSLTKLLDIEIEGENADTLGGLLYSLMEHVPEQGESIEHGGWQFTVLSLDGRRIEDVRAERVYPSAMAASTPIAESHQQPALQKGSPRPNSLVEVQAIDP